jgi:hypothetical protein
MSQVDRVSPQPIREYHQEQGIGAQTSWKAAAERSGMSQRDYQRSAEGHFFANTKADIFVDDMSYIFSHFSFMIYPA